MANSGVAPILYCSKCGSPTAVNQTYCTNCGTPQTVAPLAAAVARVQYGGFWIRLVAFIVDAFVVGVGTSPFLLLMGRGIFQAIRSNGDPDPETIIALVGGAIGYKVAVLAGGWLYEAFMLSSERQATLGKMLIGVRVTDVYGGRISFARATGRHFAKILSGLLMGIGYIIAAFTDRKQALHDMLANTLVVKG